MSGCSSFSASSARALLDGLIGEAERLDLVGIHIYDGRLDKVIGDPREMKSPLVSLRLPSPGVRNSGFIAYPSKAIS